MTSKTNKIKKAAAGILAAAVVACGMPALGGVGVMPETGITAYAESITVTWNNDDITGGPWGTSFTKDGVTITAGMIDFEDKNFTEGGTFTTTLGNFTKIEVTTGYFGASGTGWSGSTWTGNASSVSFSGEIMGMGVGNTKFVFTIELPTVDVTGVNLNKSETTLEVDASETLTATVAPANATDKTVTWTSSNTNVATVDSNGKVTAVGAGEATITATATNGTDDTTDDKTATCKVTVKKNATATYAQVGSDYTSETETDNTASLWNVTVTAGTESIEKIDVKLDSIASEEGEQTLETPIVTDAEIVLGVVTNLTGAEVNEMGGFTVMVNGKAL